MPPEQYSSRHHTSWKSFNDDSITSPVKMELTVRKEFIRVSRLSVVFMPLSGRPQKNVSATPIGFAWPREILPGYIGLRPGCS
jgi:hypothetical protein